MYIHGNKNNLQGEFLTTIHLVFSYYKSKQTKKNHIYIYKVVNNGSITWSYINLNIVHSTSTV